MATLFVRELQNIARRARSVGYQGTSVAVEHAITQVCLDRQAQVARERAARAALRAAQPLGATGVVDLTGQVRGIWRVLRYLRPGRAQAPTPIWEVACVAVGHKREMRGCALRNKPPIKCAACRRGEPAPPAEG